MIHSSSKTRFEAVPAAVAGEIEFVAKKEQEYHENGWKTSSESYYELEDGTKCRAVGLYCIQYRRWDLEPST